jgi:dienelactone hydrolase
MRLTASLVAGVPVLSHASQRSAQVLTVNDQIVELADHAPLSMQFHGGTAEECRQWQREFWARLESLLGDFRPPKEWKVVREQTVDLGDHVREQLVLQADGFPSLPVYLLTPRDGRGGRRPGVLALHGHGPYGNDAVAGIDTTPERKKDIEAFHYDYGRQLARRGYVVAAPCFTPFGRRLDDPKAYRGDDPCAVTFVRMQLLGKVLMAENLRDALWALELLSGRPEADSARLGCVGLSYGGRMTMLTSAMEPRIRVAVCSGALNIMQERITNRYSCGAQVIPGLLKYGDVPEIASLIAPRPCVWEVGSKDALMVKNRIEPALERMRRAYLAFGAEDKLKVDFFEGGHQWSGRLAYPLLEEVLQPNLTT